MELTSHPFTAQRLGFSKTLILLIVCATVGKMYFLCFSYHFKYLTIKIVLKVY